MGFENFCLTLKWNFWVIITINHNLVWVIITAIWILLFSLYCFLFIYLYYYYTLFCFIIVIVIYFLCPYFWGRENSLWFIFALTKCTSRDRRFDSYIKYLVSPHFLCLFICSWETNFIFLEESLEKSRSLHNAL